MKHMPDAKDPVLKPGNEARTRWFQHESVRSRIALLFLHGFTASPAEAGDLPEQMAHALAANLYVHRWPGHGERAADAMQDLTLAAFEESARSALAQARAMNDSVVIAGSSLGASLGLWLASEYPQQVAAVVAWSPGIRAADAALLDQLCALHNPVTVAETRARSPAEAAYWSETVHPDGYRALRSLFESFAVHPPWPRVTCPVFLGYYRSPSGEEDQTASVPAMLEMFDALGTPAAHKCAVAFDTGVHGIGSPHKTAMAAEVAQQSVAFLKQQLA
jgi:pimeloyl-ACP methyl ester carboxylesterase